MAGELNFLAGIDLDAGSLAKMQKEIANAIKQIEVEGSVMDKVVENSMQAVAKGAEGTAKGFQKGAEGAKGMGKEISNASQSASELKDIIGKELTDRLNNLASMAAKFGLAFGAEELIRKIIKVRGEFQQLEIAFETMLGSKQKANALMQQLTQTAAKTPFDMSSIASGAKQLLAYGTASEEVNDTLVKLGDIAAGLSIPLNDLVYLYGTTMAQGRMFTQDLRQLQGRGIPIADEIARIKGVAKEAVPDLVTAGEVTADIFKEALLAMSSEGGQFYNLMEKQSASLTGQISNLEDAFDQLLNKLGQEMQGTLSGGIGMIASIVEGLGEIAPLLLELVAAYGAYRVAIIAGTTAQKIATSIKKRDIALTKTQFIWTKALTKAKKALDATMITNPYVLVAAAIAAMAYGIYKIATAESAAEKATKAHADKIKELNDNYENEKKQHEDVISLLNDENAERYDQIQAMLGVEMRYDKIIRKYQDEKGRIKDVIGLQKELNKERRLAAREDKKQIIEQLKIKEADAQALANAQNARAKQSININDVKTTTSKKELDADKKELGFFARYDDLATYYAESIKKMEEELRKDELIEFKASLRDMTDAEIAEKKRLYENNPFMLQNRSQFEGSQQLAEYDAIAEEEKRRQEATEKKAVQNKSYWEKVKKDAEQALEKMDVSQVGSEEWKKHADTIENAKKMLELYNSTSKETEKIEERLAEYKKGSVSEIETLQAQKKVDALKNELAYTTDINKKLELQEKINKEILDQKIKQKNEEKEANIKNVLGDKEYKKYKEGKAITTESKNAINVINEQTAQEISAMTAQYERESTLSILEMKTKAYQDYAEEILRIEQERADEIKRIEKKKAEEIKEINEDKNLTTAQKKAEIAQVENNAEQEQKLVEDSATDEKRLLAAATGIKSDMVAEVQSLVDGIMGYSLNEIITNLETVNSEITTKIEELQGELDSGNLTPEEKAEKEKQITKLKTTQNLLTQRGTNLIKNQDKQIKKVEQTENHWIKLTKEQAEAVGLTSMAFDAVGAVADEVLSEAGDLMSDTAKDALQAISSIANFASTAMDLITQTAEITDKTSKSLMASNIIGWIMLAVQMLVKLGTFLAQYSAENQLKAEIEALGEEIERTEKKYEILEKQVTLEGNVGTKALKDKLMLAQKVNDTIDIQNQMYAETLRLLEIQRKKYGEDSDKFKETQDELLEQESEKLDTLQDQADKYQEIFEELATTNVTSFAEDIASSMVDGFAEGLRGMEMAYEDTVNNLIKEQLTKQLSLKLTDKLKPAFDKLATYTEDAELSTEEIEDFRQMLDNVKASNMGIAEEYRKIMADYGLLDDAELEAESKGFGAMSQDTADELNGRFTALQMSGANIDTNTALLTAQGIEIINHSRSIAEQVTIATQIAQQQLYELRDINANTALLHSVDDRLRNIESYTSKL